MKFLKINFSEREMLIAKIGLLAGVVVANGRTKKIRIKATQKLDEASIKHGFTKAEGHKLEEAIDQMFGDDLLT